MRVHWKWQECPAYYSQLTVEMLKNSQANHLLQNELHYLGNFKHNVKVLKTGKGDVTPFLSAVQCETSSEMLVIVCPVSTAMDCLNWRKIRKHCGKCHLKTDAEEESNTSIITRARKVLQVAVSDDGKTQPLNVQKINALKMNIFPRMHHDDIFRTVEDDELLCQFGAGLYHCYRSPRANNISQQILQLVRLLQVIQRCDQNACQSMWDAIDPPVWYCHSTCGAIVWKMYTSKWGQLFSKTTH